jgi:Fur family peroxide stress response transcriptional regulator
VRTAPAKKPVPRDVDHWCEAFQARCRERGVRLTPQRLAIYRALAADDTHPTADVVYERVRAEVPSLSQATVYRILESLESERLVRRVSTTGGVARFDANVEPHQHLVCRVCGRMIDHLVPTQAAAAIAPDAIPGFVVEELDVRLVGRCLDCARPSNSAPTMKRNRRETAPSRRRT